MKKNVCLLCLLAAGACAWLVGSSLLADPAGDWPTLAQSRGDREGPRRPNVDADTPPRPPAGPGMLEGPGRGPGMGEGPGRGPGMPGETTMGPPYGPMRRLQYGSAEVQQMDNLLMTVMRMRHVAFEPESAGLIAVGGLKDDRRKNAEIIADLEGLLAQTKTLGLRNSIRLTLRDVYRAEKQDDKAYEHLRTMLHENDAAIQAAEAKAAKK